MHVLRHTFVIRISITMNLDVQITEEEKQKEINMVACALKVV